MERSYIDYCRSSGRPVDLDLFEREQAQHDVFCGLRALGFSRREAARISQSSELRSFTLAEMANAIKETP